MSSPHTSHLTYSLGPGALSRALLELPRSKIHKLIILEDDPEYLQHLKVRLFTPLDAACLKYSPQKGTGESRFTGTGSTLFWVLMGHILVSRRCGPAVGRASFALGKRSYVTCYNTRHS